MTVMVVDDEHEVEELIRMGLERHGYSVASFLDPVEAYQYFVVNRESVCVVITDCTMPKLTGWDLARKILDIESEIRIVMITGLIETEVPEDLRHRLHRILPKPFMKSQILEAVESAHTCSSNASGTG